MRGGLPVSMTSCDLGIYLLVDSAPNALSEAPAEVCGGG